MFLPFFWCYTIDYILIFTKRAINFYCIDHLVNHRMELFIYFSDGLFNFVYHRRGNIIEKSRRVFHLKINFIVYYMTNKQIKKIVKPKLKIRNIIKIGEDDPTNSNNYLFLLNNKPVTETVYWKYVLKHKLLFPPKEE